MIVEFFEARVSSVANMIKEAAEAARLSTIAIEWPEYLLIAL